MSELQGYSLNAESATEIVCAYAASLSQVPAVLAAPGWFVVGSFYLPKTVKARLDVIAALSAAGLTGTARLYDPTPGVDAPVSGSDVSFTAQDSTRVLGGVVTLTGNKVYLIQAQVTGATGGDKYGTIYTAALAAP
jgi:hypothetical protein